MKKKLLLAAMISIVLMFGLLVIGCDLDLGTSDTGSGGGGSGGSATYTYYFVNNSSYEVTVSIGGTTGVVPKNDYRYIELTVAVTTFTYTPANLVKYTGALTGAVTFTNK